MVSTNSNAYPEVYGYVIVGTGSDTYVGVACVNGSCPVALAEQWSEYDYSFVKGCDECWLYKGCEDCGLYDGEYCTVEDCKITGFDC